jgi:hypothetical protein
MRSPSAAVLIIGITVASLSMSAQAKDGKNTAFVGGLAAGALGGVLIDKALNNYDDGQDVDAPPAPRPRLAPRPAVRPSPYNDYSYDPQPPPPSQDGQALDSFYQLRRGCMNWDRKACILMGMFLGEHRAQQAAWRRAHPDYFDWNNYEGRP